MSVHSIINIIHGKSKELLLKKKKMKKKENILPAFFIIKICVKRRGIKEKVELQLNF